jgi:hypothetical protein
MLSTNKLEPYVQQVGMHVCVRDLYMYIIMFNICNQQYILPV